MCLTLTHSTRWQCKWEHTSTIDLHNPILISCSVVTSVTIVENTDDETRHRYETEYKRHKDKEGKLKAMQPKFEFYLYNDAGRIIKQRLSIHEIQQILLQQSQSIGLKHLGWILGRNATRPKVQRVEIFGKKEKK